MTKSQGSKSLWSLQYWRDAAKNMSSVRLLVLAAVFVALRVAISTIYIPLPSIGTQRVYFSFLVNALGATIYGPVVGLVVGFVSDIIGTIVHPTGPFFFGYTLTAMVSSFIYGIFLYQRKITIPRLLCCKLTVNIIANVLMNSLWDSILIGKGYWLLVVARTPKNLIMLPIEVLLLFLFFRLIIPILKREKLISTEE